jgi:hypothetical protein
MHAVLQVPVGLPVAPVRKMVEHAGIDIDRLLHIDNIIIIIMQKIIKAIQRSS